MKSFTALMIESEEVVRPANRKGIRVSEIIIKDEWSKAWTLS
jgi:hypothetical protein